MKKHSAFSLIELSIVILIIGILIAGITQSSRLVKQARLKTARTLTQSSPVAGIADLLLWYETSLASSFDDSAQSNGEPITNWYDNSPQSPSKINATNASGSDRPFFTENVFNSGIPSVRFDGTDDYLDLSDGTGLVGNPFTIFVVEQRRNSGAMYFFGGSTALGAASTNALAIGYGSDTAVNFNHNSTTTATTGGAASYAVSGYSSPTTNIHSLIFDISSSSAGKKAYLNGASKTLSATATATLTAFAGPALGRYSTTYFNGDVGEVIIFTRALKKEERQAIEGYLSKKYGVTVSQS